MGAVCCRQDGLDLDGEVDLSHFTLLRSVGKGAFGKVRVVQHKGTKQLYALKYINKNKCIQMRAVENIISERRILEQVSHGLIVNLRYAFQDDENLFMVLDLMLGGDLRFHLDRLGVMPESYVQFYAAEVALSLRHLHKHHVVHRDIKPDNILLNEKGHAHLTDFNIAEQFTESRPLTSVAGSMAYMAPEVLLKRGYLDSVDWWSLGVVCYELLFGKRPFRGKSNEALQQAIVSKPLIFPENSQVSPEAMDFIKGLLTRDINRRLGFRDKGFQQLVNHPWMKNIQWDLLENKQAVPPFIPDSKRANFDPTHELEEILLEDNPLTVRKRNPKRSASNINSSLKSQSLHENVQISPERLLMEEKFLTFDHTRPEENELRKKEMEERRWAQRMTKTNRGGEKLFVTPQRTSSKAATTYKKTVMESLDQKPAPPLSANDIMKLEELARTAKAGIGKERGTDWRPPSAILSASLPARSKDAMQARDDYIIQAGGVPPPSKPPPLLASPTKPSFGTENGVTPYRRRSSEEGSYVSSPDRSDRLLVGTASSSVTSLDNHQQHHHRLREYEDYNHDARTSPPPPPMPLPPPQLSHSGDEYSSTSGLPTPMSVHRPVTPAAQQASSSSLSLRHPSSIPPPQLPPPTSLPPPVPTALPPLPSSKIPASSYPTAISNYPS